MSTAHDEDRSTAAGISRRSLLAVGAVGIPGLALVACSQAKAPAAEPAGGTGSGSGAGKPLAKLSDIKVGEAISATGPDGGDIIITRPTETTVAAYSAICTHEGCTVQPAGKELDCPCHGSVFDLKGAVINGPAQRPLRVVKVAVSGDDVVAG
ncbi:MAG TPA: Rieske (2Fe-2S) protein [Jatrophihabitans sp.]|jgi:Rieske Fe-S protein|nr:Rieske (2Fe-2S) protein [Jatrophihabitans sp.]